MNEFNKPIAFAELLQECRRIEVPLIQRDYAQGRDSEKDVRGEFLKALQDTLSLPEGHPSLPLNLDFIYGSMEGYDKQCFLPLDGQQRLTTLFLLHWYLAWRDGAMSDFKTRVWDGKHSRFTYSVRPSSTEFFDEIVSFQPAADLQSVDSVRGLLQNQSWFFLHWRLDPTIQSALTMLDAIHERFKDSTGLYARLVNQKEPAITFQLLTLEHFGLTDDLYIKMNARGKPLTAFETFKARFEELLKELFPTETRKIGGADLSVAEFFTRRIDTQWTDFFWHYKDSTSHTFDDALMKLIWAVVRVSLNPDSAAFAVDSSTLRIKGDATYTKFHDRGWLTREFAENLICLLEAWSQGGSKFTRLLPDTLYFDEKSFFEFAIGDPARIEYIGQVVFAAFVFYLRQHDGVVQSEPLNDWMRIVRNLAFNSHIERPDQYGYSLAGLKKLLPHSPQILRALAETAIETSGFSPQQLREEVLKAKLFVAHPEWKERICAAEQHAYFQGQIEFLLNFSGVSALAEKTPIKDWDNALHIKFQADFDLYSRKAQIMFNKDGLAATKSHLWKRALLVVGNYLVRFHRNYSFLTNPPASGDSWKRFLRDETPQRKCLKLLWDRLDANLPIEPQLVQIISSASNLEPWREAVVKYAEMIEYCGQQEIRWEDGSDAIYLLKRRQMNGAHVELFSYALYQELDSTAMRKSLEPLKIESYHSVMATESEPCIRISFSYVKGRVGFALFSSNKAFRTQVSKAELANLPQIEAALKNECGFVEDGEVLALTASRDKIHVALGQMAGSLAKLLP